MDGGEADSSSAEQRIAVKVAGRAEEILLVYECAGEGDAKTFRGLHAERMPEVAIENEVRLNGAGLHARHGHLPAGVCEIGGNDGPLNEGSTGGEGLVTDEAKLLTVRLEAEEIRAAGVPDAEDEACLSVVCGALKLGRGAEGGDENEGVDVAFVKSAESEISAANDGEHTEEGEVIAGFGTETEAAVGARERGGEEAELS